MNKESIKSARILAVDDHISTRHLYSSYLKEDYDVDLAANGVEALKLADSKSFDLIITDLIMPGMSGIQFIRKLKKIVPDSPVLVVSQTEEIDIAIDAFREQPFDFLRKPLKKQLLLNVVAKCLETARLRSDVWDLRAESTVDANCPNPVAGSSFVMEQFWRTVRSIAESPLCSSILCTGESGAGKEVVARRIHRLSNRRAHAFVAVNCALLTPELAAGELMGIEKGVATGVSPRRGKFVAANKGTLFLDEVTELPLEVQPMLLRALQEKAITPLGSHDEKPVDVRIIAATNKNLKDVINRNLFREDLFYRLSAITVEIPPLREHLEDIPELLGHLYQRHGGKGSFPLPETELRSWQQYHWPGNIRQLENAMISRIVTGLPINLETSAARNAPGNWSAAELYRSGASWDEIKIEIFRQTLRDTGGNARKAAEKLKIARSTFWEYCKKNGLLT